jgi:hypothetical protein
VHFTGKLIGGIADDHIWHSAMQVPVAAGKARQLPHTRMFRSQVPHDAYASSIRTFFFQGDSNSLNVFSVDPSQYRFGGQPSPSVVVDRVFALKDATWRESCGPVSTSALKRRASASSPTPEKCCRKRHARPMLRASTAKSVG